MGAAHRNAWGLVQSGLRDQADLNTVVCGPDAVPLVGRDIRVFGRVGRAREAVLVGDELDVNAAVLQ
jgi:hypothetical protein